MAERVLLGWAEGLSARRFYDGTGVFHAIVRVREGAYSLGVAACNRQLHYGGLLSPPASSQRCRRCAAIMKRTMPASLSAS